MVKELGEIKFTETDDGLRIDIKGKMLKEMCSCGCLPVMAAWGAGKTAECCPPEKEKK